MKRRENEDDEKNYQLLMEESALDLLGHFSTAAAILAGFFLATAVFLVSINAERQGSSLYTFLNDPISDPFGLALFLQQNLPEDIVKAWWPTHFEYMLVIFVGLFVLAMLSYVCYIMAGLEQMRALEGKTTLERVWFWQRWGLRILMIGLVAAFISLPWAIIRFAYEHALGATFFILAITMVFAYIVNRIRILRKKRRLSRLNQLNKEEEKV